MVMETRVQTLTRLFAFSLVLIPVEKAGIQLFSFVYIIGQTGPFNLARATNLSESAKKFTWWQILLVWRGRVNIYIELPLFFCTICDKKKCDNCIKDGHELKAKSYHFQISKGSITEFLEC